MKYKILRVKLLLVFNQTFIYINVCACLSGSGVTKNFVRHLNKIAHHQQDRMVDGEVVAAKAVTARLDCDKIPIIKCNLKFENPRIC